MHMSAFKALYQVAQHPLLSTQQTPEVLAVRTACASSCSEYGPSEADDTCSLPPGMALNPGMAGDCRAELQPEEVLQASKCGSLLHLLRSSGPAVVTSSFPAVLKICGMLLAHAGIPCARLDSKSHLDDCMNVTSAFAAGKAQVVLVQQQVALKYPMLDLSRAELCVFYDSGLSRSVRPPHSTPTSPCSSLVIGYCVSLVSMQHAHAMVPRLFPSRAPGGPAALLCCQCTRP